MQANEEELNRIFIELYGLQEELTPRGTGGRGDGTPGGAGTGCQVFSLLLCLMKPSWFFLKKTSFSTPYPNADQRRLSYHNTSRMKYYKKNENDMKILVVDDDPHILELVTIHLSQKTGYTVEKALNGSEALSMLENNFPDLAIVDVMMPGMNGYELTKKIRAEADIPVLLLTAKGELEDKEKGFLAGADDYVVKPFEPKKNFCFASMRSCAAMIGQWIGSLKQPHEN